MESEVVKVALKEIQPFRIQFLQERNFQFTYDKCHYYGWADTYLFLLDGVKAGYGSVWGKDKREERDSIFEFYMIEPFRKWADVFFQKFQAVSGAAFIECQSNDPLLVSMLYEYSRNIRAEAILFADSFQTHFELPGVFLQRKEMDGNMRGDERPYVLVQDGEAVASGGMMLNYNLPYADLYYEVAQHHRRQGLGTFMVQELKKEAYAMGRVPAARCNIRNGVSKATLLKAGFGICGHRVNGKIDFGGMQ